MSGLVSHFRRRARHAARAAAFTVAGVIFGMAGLAFLTVALWILIATYESALVAHAVIGALYLLLGICFLAFGGQSTDAETAPQPAAPKEPLLQVAEAFAVGLNAGRAARAPRS
ncbi:putative Actinobacterial holin-X, holin superfamily III [Roseovarius mucosus]|uniref:Putative Actinobacterial holin-X, holin superfamily III n=1 Tax=Roseovarius mucosus TaxID=215743 RepID=A0A1V0RSB1_9RHOB|nr:phage holin family protein [Roseovarius mucosus]ARE84535.1 putative Actinobacterial holin-X, holin superfamily III [Roseovarius mucosus]